MSSDEKSKRKKQTTRPDREGASRRDFLVTTAAAGAGLFLTGKALAQEPPVPAPAEGAPAPAAPPPAAAAPAEAAPAAPAPAAPAVVSTVSSGKDLNIALIGLGAQGMVLADALLRIPGIRFKAVCDIWQYSLKRGSGMLRKYGHQATAYQDYRDLFDKEKDLQAVVVATPDFVHHEHSIAAMKAGYHVYCEKEMSNQLDNARLMVTTARETGRLLQIGHQRRSNPRYRHAIDVLLHDNHLAGRVTQGYGQWNRAKSDDLGWPKKYEIDPATLEKYGFDSMQHFRNWRWYKKYGGGPIVDLGSHQIDIFAWVFGVQPKSVMAGGGIDFYKHHEWYDNVLCTYEYENSEGVSRAFYQVLTTTSYGGFYEAFMGENGTLVISEVPTRGNHFLREAHAPEWEPFVSRGLLAKPPSAEPAQKSRNVVLDVRVSAELGSWPIPVQLLKPAHQPHLENFFDAIRLGAKLNCPGEEAFKTAVAVLKANEAVEAGHKIEFRPEEFTV